MRKAGIYCGIIVLILMCSCGRDDFSHKENNTTMSQMESILENAIDQFPEKESVQILKEKANSFAVVSGTEMQTLLQDQWFDVIERVILKGSDRDTKWDGWFHFEKNGNVEETVMGETGHFNARAWKINDNTLTIFLYHGCENERADEYVLRRITDSIYLGTINGEPMLLMKDQSVQQ